MKTQKPKKQLSKESVKRRSKRRRKLKKERLKTGQTNIITTSNLDSKSSDRVDYVPDESEKVNISSTASTTSKKNKEDTSYYYDIYYEKDPLAAKKIASGECYIEK